MTTEQQVALVKITQPAVHLDENLYVHMGWRPAAVMVFNGAADTTKGLLVQADNAAIDASGKKAMILSGGNVNAQISGTDSVEIVDRGFNLYHLSPWVGDNGAQITCLVFRTLAEHHEVQLPASAADLPAKGEAYGDGKMFDASQDRKTGAVTKRSDLGAFGVYRI